MKVILVNGSPHKTGCTYTALTEIEKELNANDIDTEIFWVGTKPLSGCIACGTCVKTGKCAFDDSVNEFVKLAEMADGFIFGSPVHYAAASGTITSFMDRVFYSASCAGKSEIFRYKPASAVFSARRGGTTASYDQLNKYFGINEMPIISSCYWNGVHGTSPEEVAQDAEGLMIMRVLGRNMAYFLKCLKAGQEAGLPLPRRESPVKTNFIR